ncbi:hypothetical protein BU24DRAFT_262828 [Aaosphaeria arxii CBS 175.79]|uniref:Secreted protein n=1 Tax=Aaosphaeria arxii CBS 175.79 TaxID=1450172 RepID=A0A6A5XIF9_9PLEO|nr:uncharacterized protein BU24DRAFT_262828 [Aaosphaeria arxii CBS 175.79]KAF2013038.1 hypothetical protein BU24DRAFT_262828 [Aaosphaeria arxii CBS 175.79]
MGASHSLQQVNRSFMLCLIIAFEFSSQPPAMSGTNIDWRWQLCNTHRIARPVSAVSVLFRNIACRIIARWTMFPSVMFRKVAIPTCMAPAIQQSLSVHTHHVTSANSSEEWHPELRSIIHVNER